MMRRFAGFYNPKLLLYIVRKIQKSGYDPDEFMAWFLSFPDIAKETENYPKKLNKQHLLLAVFGYYFWFFYILSALLIFFINQAVGLGALVLSPFVSVGVIYAYIYCVWHLKYARKAGKSAVRRPKTAEKSRKK